MMFRTVTRRCTNKITKAVISCTLASLMILTWPFTAMAEDVGDEVASDDVIHNEEQLDPDTGLPNSQEINVPTNNRLTDTISYNVDTDRFEYTFDANGNSKVAMNVSDGMVTNGKVYIEVTTDLQYELLYEGKDVTGTQTLSGIEKAGTYALLVGFGNSAERAKLTFRIVKKYAKITEYQAPDGFYFTSAMYEGEEMEISRSTVDLTAEGKYVIQAVCDYTGKVYTLDVTTDHTAPTITLKGVDSSNLAYSAVEIQNVEADATVHIEKDGKTIAFKNTLAEYGKYHIIVTDPAGNSTTYDFTIRVYFSNSGIVFFIIVGLIILAVIAFLVIAKRRFRVR